MFMEFRKSTKEAAVHLNELWNSIRGGEIVESKIDILCLKISKLTNGIDKKWALTMKGHHSH